MNNIKQWIVSTFFQDHLNAVLIAAARKGSIDAFKKAHTDVLETMRDDLDKQAEELAQKKLSTLLSVVDLNNVIRIDKVKRVVYIGETLADDSTLANLKSEAEFIEASELWKILCETPKELAQQAMFVNGENIESMTKGRAILYTLKAQTNIIETLKSYQGK